MSEESIIKTNIPQSRQIQRPYFLLTTADGVGHYLKEERPGMNTVNQALFSRRERIVEYLAPGVLKRVESEGGSGRKHYQIDYEISDEITDTAVPLESVSDSLIEEFSAAAEAFLGRDGQHQFAQHERGLRENFKVPDPELEPDCYWLYGTPGDRKLLILWGCEKKERTSIPLLPDLKQPGKNLLDWFKANRMGWAGKQQEMQRLLRAGNHSLRDFLAFPTIDRKGAVKGYNVGGKEYPAKAFRKARHVPAAQVESFATAAAKFYEEAEPDAAGLSTAEKELRCSFTLPDPEVRPDAQLRMGKRFVFALGPDLREEQCLQLCANETLSIPGAVTGESGGKVIPPTIEEKLRERITPVKLYTTLGAVAAVLLIIALSALYMMSDRTPPTVIEVVAENDPDQVMVVFNERILPSSLVHSEGDDSQFRILALTGKVHQIGDVTTDPDDPNRAIVPVAPALQDAVSYRLQVRGVADTSFHRNRMSDTQTVEFTWYDRVPPKLEKVSAEGSNESQLLLFFNKALDPATATRAVNFRIPGFRILDAEFYLDDPSIVLLTAERDSRRLEEGDPSGFIHLGEYELEVGGIRDATSSRNTMEDVQKLEFLFRDTVPPRVMEVVSNENQWIVRVQFSEPLDQASAESSSHYIIRNEEGERLEILGAQLAANSRGVALTSTPLFPGIQYTLAIRGVRDASPERNAIPDWIETGFNYRGRVDEIPPVVESVDVSADRYELEVTFNEEVRADSAEVAEHYEVLNSNITVDTARRLGTGNRRFLLGLSSDLPAGSMATLRTSGIVDRVGNLSENADMTFPVPGEMRLFRTLIVESGEALSSTRISLVLSDAVLPDRALRAENYILSAPYQVERLQYDQDARSITLELSAEHPFSAGEILVEIRNQRLISRPDRAQAAVTTRIQAR